MPPCSSGDTVPDVFRYIDGSVQMDDRWRTLGGGLSAIDHGMPAIDAASAAQRRIGELLPELAADIRRVRVATGSVLVAVFFYNTTSRTRSHDSARCGT